MIACSQIILPRIIAEKLTEVLTVRVTATAETSNIAAPCVVVTAPDMVMKTPALAVLNVLIETRYRPDIEAADDVCELHESALGHFQALFSGGIAEAAAGKGIALRKAHLTGSAHNTDGAERQSQITAIWRVEAEAI